VVILVELVVRALVDNATAQSQDNRDRPTVGPWKKKVWSSDDDNDRALAGPSRCWRAGFRPLQCGDAGYRTPTPPLLSLSQKAGQENPSSVAPFERCDPGHATIHQFRCLWIRNPRIVVADVVDVVVVVAVPVVCPWCRDDMPFAYVI